MADEERKLIDLFNDFHKMLYFFSTLNESVNDPDISERFHIAEVAMLKYLKTLRERFGIGYEDDQVESD